MTDGCDDLVRFVKGECDPANFPHREHIRMAFEMLRRHSFAETAMHYSQALRIMANRAGRPTAYHETITIAFLSLTGERMQIHGPKDFDSFARGNADLFEKCVLERWYGRERLSSDAARRTFLLPEPLS